MHCRHVLVIIAGFVGIVRFAIAANQIEEGIQLYQKSLPCVVMICSLLDSHHSFYQAAREHSSSYYDYCGSGVVIESSGYILTASHVVSDFYAGHVILADGSVLPYQLIGNDAYRDIAIIKIARNNLTSANISTKDLALGQFVYTIGNPIYHSFSYTSGTISLPITSVGSQIFTRVNLSIYPGNSGGPLFNQDGDLIGILTEVETVYMGEQHATPALGSVAAIPIANVVPEIEQLKKFGYFTGGQLHFYPQSVNGDLAKYYGINQNVMVPSNLTPPGLLVAGLPKHSHLAKDGLKDEDYIVKINGQAIPNLSWFTQYIYLLGPKQPVTLSILRNQQQVIIQTTTDEMPRKEMVKPLTNFPKLSLQLREVSLTPEHNFGYQSGLKIVTISDYLYKSQELYKDAILVECNHQKLTTSNQLTKILQNTHTGQQLLCKYLGLKNNNWQPYYALLTVN